MYRIPDNFKLDSPALSPKTVQNTSVNGTGISITDATSITVVCSTGVIPSGGAITYKIQESADNSTYSDLSGYTATGVQDIISLIEVPAFAVGSGKKYIRVVATESGNQAVYTSCFYVKASKQKPA